MVQRIAAYAIGRSPQSNSHLRSTVTELTECHPVFPSQFPSPNLVKVPSSSRAGLVTETQSSEKTKKGPPWTQLPLSCREHRNLSLIFVHFSNPLMYHYCRRWIEIMGISSRLREFKSKARFSRRLPFLSLMPSPAPSQQCSGGHTAASCEARAVRT